MARATTGSELPPYVGQCVQILVNVGCADYDTHRIAQSATVSQQRTTQALGRFVGQQEHEVRGCLADQAGNFGRGFVSQDNCLLFHNLHNI